MSGTPVVHVVPYYPPHVGGMENIARAVAELLARKHPVHVLTTSCGAREAPPVERRDGLTVRRLNAREIAHVPVAPLMLAHLLRVPRRSVVHVHIAQALLPEMVWLARRLRGGTFVAHFHLDVPPSGPFGRVFVWYKNHVLGRTLRAAAKVITFSADQARFIERTYRVHPNAITIIPNGVGPEFAPKRTARTKTTSGRPLRVLYVGRLSPQKAVPRLVTALAVMTRPVQARIVGDGDERPKVEDLLREHALTSVQLPGVLRGPELIEAYHWADVLVLPSNQEGMPLAALEAMACGLPVVATDVIGNRELLKDVGLLVPPDAGALALTLDQLALDPDLLGRLRQRAIAASREYTVDRLVERLERLYDEVAPT